MALKLFNLYLVLLLVSCSLSFDKEIINYGPILKSFDQIKIKKGETSKSIIIKNLGPPSFINPYDNKNVYYISQKMLNFRERMVDLYKQNLLTQYLQMLQ